MSATLAAEVLTYLLNLSSSIRPDQKKNLLILDVEFRIMLTFFGLLRRTDQVYLLNIHVAQKHFCILAPPLSHFVLRSVML